MERRKTETLRDVIYRYLRLEGLETPLNEQRAMDAYATVVGPAIAKQSSELQIHNRILYVKIARPALRQDLMMMRTQLAQRINQAIGAQAIEQIMFH